MISASVNITAQFYHLDPMEIVWHGNYVRFFEQARCALLDKIDYNYAQMQASGYAWPVVDLSVRYVRPVRFHQEMTVTATLEEYENRLVIKYKITDAETGEKLTTGKTVQVCVDGQSEEMQFVSPEVLISNVEQLL